MQRIFVLIVAMLFFGIGVAEAQLPGMPPPDIPNKEGGTLPKCTKDYESFVKEQIDFVEQLRKAPVEVVLKVRGGLEMFESLLATGSKFLGGDKDMLRNKIEDIVNDVLDDELRKLGIPRVDFRLAKKLLDQGAGDLERNAVTELGRLKSELLRCGAI